jgi:hypothetical protein
MRANIIVETIDKIRYRTPAAAKKVKKAFVVLAA